MHTNRIRDNNRVLYPKNLSDAENGVKRAGHIMYMFIGRVYTVKWHRQYIYTLSLIGAEVSA